MPYSNFRTIQWTTPQCRTINSTWCKSTQVLTRFYLKLPFNVLLVLVCTKSSYVMKKPVVVWPWRSFSVTIPLATSFSKSPSCGSILQVKWPVWICGKVSALFSLTAKLKCSNTIRIFSLWQTSRKKRASSSVWRILRPTLATAKSTETI